MTALAGSDEKARRHAVEATARSLLVEASAGTGKTHTLVSRILQLVVEDGVPLARIAAVTFTEKAAGEMKERVRKRLDELAPSLSGEKALRAERARRDLEAAEIGTLHAFCSRLLRERPVEAGLDPDFLFPEESVATDLVRQAFRGWALAEMERDGSPLAAAIREGAKGKDLRTLAEQLYGARAFIDGTRVPSDVLGEARAHVRHVRTLFERLEEEATPSERADERGRQIRALILELAELETKGLDAMATWASPNDPGRQRPARKGNWGPDTREARDAAFGAARTLRRALESLPLEETLVELLDLYQTSLLPEIEAEKRRRAFVDFDDLLVEARRLLRSSPAARAHFRERYRAIIVDEFQDTDPVQAEIVLRLAAPEPQGETLASLVPEPGRLFLVGDPKQSIFRFRRADVETYDAVRALVAPEDRVVLTASRRARKPLLDYVNEVFAPVLRRTPGKPWEVPYAPLEAVSEAHDTRRPELIHLLPPATLPASKDAVQKEEARAVANLLRARLKRKGESFHDVAVLCAKNETVETYRDVLDEYGIPVVLEGGTSFYRREETAAVLAALTAIDDPGDGVALVAALKSFLFGVDDWELLLATEAGVRFDAPDTLARSETLRPHAELLERLRRRRHDRPFAETVSELLAARAAELLVRAECVPFGLQASANLERLVLNARALDREGLSFREARERLAARVEDRIGEPRAVEETHDAVRVTTIHKAKGLEYDTVVVAGLGLSTEREPDSRLRAAGGEWGARLEFGNVTASTPGFARIDDAEAERRAAERKRLLYVAFTRAKRRLVVSTFARPKQSGGLLDGTFLEPIAFAFADGALQSRVERVPADVTPPPEGRASDSLGLDAGDLEGALALVDGRRARLLERAALPLARAGRVEPSLEDAPSFDRSGAGGARALRVGVAVHAAMERLLAPGAPEPDEARLESVLGALDDAGPEDLPEIRRLVKRLLSHDVVARALASKRRFLELPVLFRDGEAQGAPLVEGKIDLLFEEEDGFTIVDWKTDRLSGDEERRRTEERYAPQLAAYAAGLAAVLGPGTRIKERRLVFARAW